MSETIVGAFIGGICAIIGAIISPIITYKLNNFSKIHRISKNNTKTNEVTRHDIDKNRTRKNKLATPVATCQGRIHHFSSFFLDFPCFPCTKSWRMTRLSLSSTLWVLVSEKCTSTK